MIGLIYLPYAVIDVPLALIVGRLSDKFVSVHIFNLFMIYIRNTAYIHCNA